MIKLSREQIESNRMALLEGMQVPGGLISGFFRIGSIRRLETDYFDGYTRKEIEKMQREVWGGRWGKPKPENKNNFKKR